MKNEKGITMISVVISILVLLLISSITITFNMEAYRMVKVQNFISQLKVIQAKVDDVAESKKEIETLGFTKLSAIAQTKKEDYVFFQQILNDPIFYNIDTTSSWTPNLDEDKENYYYFDSEMLKQLGLKNQELTVIINFKTRNVIAKQGVKQEGKTYYRQYDLGNAESLGK